MKNSSQRLSFSEGNFFWTCSGKRRINSKDTAKTMKKAFSMVELIFVIVLMGILAAIGGNMLPDNRLLNATNYVTMKLKETQKNAIGYDVNGFNAPWSETNSTTCIDLNVTGFEEKDLNSTKPFKFGLVKVEGSGIDTKLCFDEYGRPYNQSEQKLLTSSIDINVTYNGQRNTISVFPMSGYVTLSE